MTNIDFDHPDYFSSIDDVFDAFQEMALQVNKGIIACGDDEHLPKIHANVPVVYYGTGEENDFQARNIVKARKGQLLMSLSAIRSMIRFIFLRTATTMY